MRIHYDLKRLRGLREVDLATVDFETVETCPICGDANLLDVSQLSGSLITAWCGGCGHLFHRRRPTHAWYRNWYSQSWDTQGNARTSRHRLAGWVEPILRGVSRRLDPKGGVLIRGSVFDFCRPVVRRSSRVLDVGCGYGRDLRAFGRLGCRTFGIEACPHRAKAAGALGIRTVPLGVEELTPQTFNGRFDLVTSNHVLEHVYDPSSFLASVTRILNPGGWLYLAVPNVERDFLLHDFFFALHIHCFSRNSLESLLTRHGFITHRVQEEHQLRLLVQWRPEAAAKAVPWRVDRKAELLAGDIAAGVLGPDYLARPGRVGCGWAVSRTRLGELFETKYSDVREPNDHYPRFVHLQWDGAEALPLQFVSQQTGDAPFWVK
jgi:2-polyprenyl-3-methyl-5-hydroxy-6-metoxy-1,4-benzoquinol methylase